MERKTTSSKHHHAWLVLYLLVKCSVFLSSQVKLWFFFYIRECLSTWLYTFFQLFFVEWVSGLDNGQRPAGCGRFLRNEKQENYRAGCSLQ